MLVLDASGSMWGQIGGRAKIEIAREAVGSMLSNWPGSQQLGFMAYGHRSKGDCSDIQMLKAPGKLDKASFAQAVNALQPKGMTPISASVRMAAEQLKFSERKATVILVSDGEETCHADPCALGTELEKLGVDFTAHVVGFDIEKNPKAKAQLQCLASSTGGRYLDAKNAGELNQALREVAKAPEPKPAPEPFKQPEAQIDAPAQVMAGDKYEFKASGPKDGDEPDSSYHIVSSRAGEKSYGFGGFDHTKARGEGVHSMHAPAQPGRYELHYIRRHRPTNQDYFLASRPIEVLPVAVRFTVADSYMAGEQVDIGYSGPSGGGVINQVRIVRVADGADADRISLGEMGIKNIKVRMPKQPGEYDLVYRYITGNEAHGRTRIRVVPKTP